jgi:hypothetical protein
MGVLTYFRDSKKYEFLKLDDDLKEKHYCYNEEQKPNLVVLGKMFFHYVCATNLREYRVLNDTELLVWLDENEINDDMEDKGRELPPNPNMSRIH